ncbi:hypothetical protein [Vibrio furnissii]|uniref:hypothetical protein n=1 Tax=Vibrio furnissii TaxID=29494 RepID=UPI0012AD8CC0|nr:hypothetical protein [Vibrio furnissii]
MNIIQARKFLLAGISALFAALLSFSVMASLPGLDYEEMEMDGNVEDTNFDGLPDWETINDQATLVGIAEFFQKDKNGTDEIFWKGSSKDEIDITEWWFRSGSPQPKDDFTNAYAAAFYNDQGELLLYYGADRYANNGDMYVGFWFLQSNVGIPEGQARGEFYGAHADGDILVLISFPQSAAGKPYIQVLEWQGGGGDVATNLVERFVTFGDPKDPSFVGAKCGESFLGNDLVCGIANEEPVPLPNVAGWTYQAKTGETNEFPYESFVEGRLNLSKLFLGRDIPCFSSFLVESRASRSIDASLADFVVGSFELCSIDVSKTCSTASFNNDGTFNVDYTIQVKNTGPGTIDGSQIVTIDDTPSDGTPFMLTNSAAGYGAGSVWEVNEVLNIMGSYVSDVNGGTNYVTASVTTGPTSSISDSLDAAVPCDALQLTPLLTISKACDAYLEATGGLLAVAKQYEIEVCNTGNVPLDVTSLTDDKDASLNASFDLDYALSCNDPSDTSCGAGNECALFNSESNLYACRNTATTEWMPAGSGGDICVVTSGSYYPSSLAELVGMNGTLSNQATVKATSPVADTGLLSTVGQQSDPATCDLCPAPTTPPASN